MGVASLLVDQYYPMKFALSAGAAVDLLHSLFHSMGGVVLMDAIFICMVMVVRKEKKTSPATQSDLRFHAHAADEPFD